MESLIQGFAREALVPFFRKPYMMGRRSYGKLLWPVIFVIWILSAGCSTLPSATPTNAEDIPKRRPSGTIIGDGVSVPGPQAVDTQPPSSVAYSGDTGHTPTVPLREISVSKAVSIQTQEPSPSTVATRKRGLPSRAATPAKPVAEPESSPTGIPKPPVRDLYELARSLNQAPDVVLPLTYDAYLNLKEGDRENFYVVDLVGVRTERIDATLKLVSAYAYWYVEDGLSISKSDLEAAAHYFDQRIYPEVTKTFGPLWPAGFKPGHRITILNASLRGFSGYYSSADEHPTAAHQLSNQRKMIYLNSAVLKTGSPDYLSILTHELQHAVHWNLNKGQSTWLNEGLSQVAQNILGFLPHTITAFSNNLPVSLVYWPLRALDSASNYGAAFLYAQFLSNQYALNGDLRPLIETGEAGIDAVDDYLASLGEQDDFDTLFGRWIVANYLGEAYAGPFGYGEFQVDLRHTDVLDTVGTFTRTQPQYSARYFLLDLEEEQVNVTFSGDSHVTIVPVDPPTANHCWWSNRGDSISTTLTREVDLSLTRQATLRFRLWYEIEENWDYAYVQVSTNGGLTWDIVSGDLSTDRNPVGSSYGPGYSGISNGWVEDAVDLTPYVGQKVLVRFHYVTDDASNGTGVCLDTIEIPEIGFLDDASEDKGWVSEGFFRTDNRVPQGYSVWFIETRNNRDVIRLLELEDSNQGRITLSNLEQLDRLVVVVGSLSRNSSQKARYRLILESGE